MTNAQAIYIAKLQEIHIAAAAFLSRIDHITTQDFERGGDRVEREALRAALEAL